MGSRPNPMRPGIIHALPCRPSAKLVAAENRPHMAVCVNLLRVSAMQFRLHLPRTFLRLQKTSPLVHFACRCTGYGAVSKQPRLGVQFVRTFSQPERPDDCSN